MFDNYTSSYLLTVCQNWERRAQNKDLYILALESIPDWAEPCPPELLARFPTSSSFTIFPILPLQFPHFLFCP